ncbi:MAG: class I SAM-dependent methyltransferase [Thermoleophilia bacterium]
MSTSKKEYTRIFNRASEAPAHFLQRNEVPAFIKQAVELTIERKGRGGKALDVGCASGFYSMYLAQQGFQVTALDYIPAALKLARERASEAGMDIDFIEADITTWENPEKYDFVLDSGCLHNFTRGQRASYRSRFPNWLADDATFVLVHFGKRSFMDINLHLGRKVRRATRDETESFFRPVLTIEDFFAEPGNRALYYYRFSRNTGL